MVFILIPIYQVITKTHFVVTLIIRAFVCVAGWFLYAVSNHLSRNIVHFSILLTLAKCEEFIEQSIPNYSTQTTETHKK